MVSGVFRFIGLLVGDYSKVLFGVDVLDYHSPTNQPLSLSFGMSQLDCPHSVGFKKTSNNSGFDIKERIANLHCSPYPVCDRAGPITITLFIILLSTPMFDSFYVYPTSRASQWYLIGSFPTFQQIGSYGNCQQDVFFPTHPS